MQKTKTRAKKSTSTANKKKYKLNTVKDIVGKIKRLEIQGAKNIAKEAVKAILFWAGKSGRKSEKSFIAELEKNTKLLTSARATEPMLRNALNHITLKAKNEHAKKNSTQEKIKKVIISTCNDYLVNLPKEHDKISKFGSNLIQDGNTVLIHCHSNTVMGVLKKAFDKGTKFNVICTETRPRFQGRMSAKELSNYGINTTLIVDSAARHIMDDVDLFFSGSDAITSDGFMVNKIGTSLISLAAKLEEVNHYVCTSSQKFDPLTIHGFVEPIENRDPNEVISTKIPKNLKVLNPAFDYTEIELIRGIVCELGVLTPATFIATMIKDTLKNDSLEK